MRTVVAYSDGIGAFEAGAPLGHVDGMRCGIDVHVRRKENVRAEGDLVVAVLL